MQDFYFIYRNNKETVYHAVLKGELYLINWGVEGTKLSYKKNEVERYIRDKNWVIINDLIEAEDF